MKPFLALAITASLALLSLAEDPEPCKDCSGTHVVSCKICDEKGDLIFTCNRCDGEANSACKTCAGKGWVTCHTCGDGFKAKGTCKTCHGDRKVNCDKCKMGKSPCDVCSGKGKVRQDCPACAGAGRRECLRCIRWGDAISRSPMPGSRPEVKDALRLFVVPDGGLNRINAAMKKALPGQTNYKLDRVHGASIGIWKDKVAVFAVAFLKRPPELATNDTPLDVRAVIQSRNNALLGETAKEARAVALAVWNEKWSRDASYIVVAIMNSVQENDGVAWRPAVAYACPTEKFDKSDYALPEFDLGKAADWTYVDPKMKF